LASALQTQETCVLTASNGRSTGLWSLCFAQREELRVLRAD